MNSSTSEYGYCDDCLIEYRDEYGSRFDFEFTDNCDSCDDLIGETEKGRVYRNNRPGRQEVYYAEIKKQQDLIAKYTDEIEMKTLEVEKTMAYMQKFTESEAKERLAKARKAVGLPQATGPDDVGKAGREIAIPSDVVPTPFVNYKRPLASPHMEIKVPHETETGVVMPPLPKHECELPNAVKTHTDKWESKNNRDEVVEPDGSIYTCMCGKNWYVRVQKVPYHISSYDPQYVYKWRPVRWYQFGRKADIRKRKEQ
jgi:hypothetical protein